MHIFHYYLKPYAQFSDNIITVLTFNDTGDSKWLASSVYFGWATGEMGFSWGGGVGWTSFRFGSETLCLSYTVSTVGTVDDSLLYVAVDNITTGTLNYIWSSLLK